MIELKQVTKIYPDGTKAVDDLSLEINKGEICALLGPSGCGKTTTMKMINRLIPITSGRIYINGEDNTKMNEDELRQSIGYAIQQIGLFPHMSVGENIQIVPVLRGWPEEKRERRAKELLELVGLNPAIYFNRYPAELSGGQMQRVGVARSLGADPEILLMDEPFGAIDPITRNKLQDEFLKIQEEIKKTIVFVTHDLNEAMKMGDKIALLKKGRLVQYDTPTNLLYKPKNEFVRNFVGADRALQGLRLLKVKEVMDASPPTIKASDSVKVAINQLEEKKVTWLMVINSEGRFLGWVGKKDLATCKKQDKVEKVMIPSVTTASPETFLNEALSSMLNSAIGNLAITDSKGMLKGVLTFDIIREVLGKTYTEESSK